MSGRPAIVKVTAVVEDEDVNITVSLSWGEMTYLGTASGSTLEADRPRLVGEATLRAVEQVTEGNLQLELAAMATTVLGDARVAMAQIRVVGTDQVLVGNSLIPADDPSLAAVKAVMDAINRPLGQLI